MKVGNENGRSDHDELLDKCKAKAEELRRSKPGPASAGRDPDLWAHTDVFGKVPDGLS